MTRKQRARHKEGVRQAQEKHRLWNLNNPEELDQKRKDNLELKTLKAKLANERLEKRIKKLKKWKREMFNKTQNPKYLIGLTG